MSEKSSLRTFFYGLKGDFAAQSASDIIIDQAQRGEKSPADISFFAQQYFNDITRSVAPSKKASFPDFFANNFNPAIEEMKAYADRLSGFDNLDQKQFFSPGLYVIGATPAAAKLPSVGNFSNSLLNAVNLAFSALTK